MKILLLFCILNIFYYIISAAAVKKCEYSVKPLRTRVPILVKNDEIFYPDSEIISFKPRETITLACPGRLNRFDLPVANAIQAIDVTCSNGKLNSSRGIINLYELNCTRAQPAADIETTIPCANGEGILKEISFRYLHNDIIKIIPLYKTCYNKDKWESLYAAHTINGGYWQDVLRSSFVDAGSDLPKEYKLNTYYNQKQQNETILKIHQNLTVYWLKNYLARGHLAPCADFNYCTMQAASFYYINAAPQWQKFNAGNWLSIEYQVRNLVKTRQEPLTVFTGSHDILKLKDVRGKWHPIFLVDKTLLPVPKYYWKVVYSPKSKESIAFVGLNNIYADSTKDIDSLCKNICQQQGFHMPSYDDPTKGLITCCKLTEIKKKIPRMGDIPTGISKVMMNIARDRTYAFGQLFEVITGQTITDSDGIQIRPSTDQIDAMINNYLTHNIVMTRGVVTNNPEDSNSTEISAENETNQNECNRTGTETEVGNYVEQNGNNRTVTTLKIVITESEESNQTKLSFKNNNTISNNNKNQTLITADQIKVTNSSTVSNTEISVNER